MSEYCETCKNKQTCGNRTRKGPMSIKEMFKNPEKLAKMKSEEIERLCGE